MLAFVPSGSDAKDCAAAREDIERRHDLCQKARIAIADAGHEQAEFHSFRAGGNEPEGGVALEHRIFGAREPLHLEVVIHEGEHRAAGRLGRFRRVQDVTGNRAWATWKREVHEVNADLHGSDCR